MLLTSSPTITLAASSLPASGGHSSTTVTTASPSSMEVGRSGPPRIARPPPRCPPSSPPSLPRGCVAGGVRRRRTCSPLANMAPLFSTLATRGSTQVPWHEKRDAPLIAYCNGGVAATVPLFAPHRLGYRNLANYDGSWNEWGAREDLPVEKEKPP